MQTQRARMLKGLRWLKYPYRCQIAFPNLRQEDHSEGIQRKALLDVLQWCTNIDEGDIVFVAEQMRDDAIRQGNCIGKTDR